MLHTKNESYNNLIIMGMKTSAQNVHPKLETKSKKYHVARWLFGIEFRYKTTSQVLLMLTLQTNKTIATQPAINTHRTKDSISE